MANKYLIAVHDFTGKRLCTVFDSTIPQIGSAYSIKINKEINGWKDLEFTVGRYDANGNKNYRCNYLNNENYIYLYEDDVLDIYCIKTPVDSHETSKLYITCACNHISEELKARNLYKFFDDTNGIGTCIDLITKAIGGTGWTLGECDTFYEADGTTEKVRSYSCDIKTGAYNMISGICKLFDARPVFDGGSRTVHIRANSRTDSWMEISYGKNIDKIKVSRSSSSFVTRLYVEGEYGDYGYVGIDSVNPTGLPFILNFDYFKETGVFTDAHQEIVDEYLVDYKAASDAITEHTAHQLEQQTRLYELIGGTAYAYYPVVGGRIYSDNRIIGNGMTQENANMNVGDKIVVVQADGTYTHEEYVSSHISNGICVFKFIPVVTGLLATYEDKISAGEVGLESNVKNLNKFFTKNGYENVTIQSLKATYKTQDLSIVKDDGFDLTGLDPQYVLSTTLDYVVSIGVSENNLNQYIRIKKELMLELIDLVIAIDESAETAKELIENQTIIEDNFISTMGAMLRDGYWSDTSYVPGQEESLYQDALGISSKMGKPVTTYTIDLTALSSLPEYKGEDFDVAQSIHVYDKELEVNDYCVSTKLTLVPDNPLADTITVDTDLIDVANKSFSTVLEHVTEMAEDVRRNRNVYKRAAAISSEGKFRTDMLDGAIDVMKTQLLSSASNWKTDSNGNILLEALDGMSAMMLAGSGFMIANSKNENGEWQWRTFGTGEGFAADMITTGFLSSDRIESKSITTNHLSSEVGENLDLSSNETVNITADKINQIADQIDLSANQSVVTAVTDSDAFSEVSQTADKINWIIESGTGSSDMTLTDDAYGVIADNINLEGNTSVYLAVKGNGDYQSDIELTPDKLNLAIQDSDSSTIIQETIGKINAVVSSVEGESSVTLTPQALTAIAENIDLSVDSLKIHSNSADTVNLWMTFDPNQGLIIHVPDSMWRTRTGDNGYYVERTDRSSPILACYEDKVRTPSLQVGDGDNDKEIVCKRTSNGGWVWTDA